MATARWFTTEMGYLPPLGTLPTPRGMPLPLVDPLVVLPVPAVAPPRAVPLPLAPPPRVTRDGAGVENLDGALEDGGFSTKDVSVVLWEKEFVSDHDIEQDSRIDKKAKLT